MKIIFIGGTGRCGTTVLKQIFGLSPGTQTLSKELHVHIRKGGLLSIVNRKKALSEDAFKLVMRRLRRSAKRASAALAAANETYKLTRNQYEAAEAMFRTAFPTQGIPVEDTPDNMWYGEDLGKLLPASIFIHIVRHPVQVLESTQRMHWARPTFKDTAEYLRRSYQRCLKNEEELGDRCLRVRLEDLITDTEAVKVNITNFTGIDISAGVSLLRETPRVRPVSKNAKAAAVALEPFIGELGYT